MDTISWSRGRVVRLARVILSYTDLEDERPQLMWTLNFLHPSLRNWCWKPFRGMLFLERLRFKFTPKGKREFVPRDEVYPQLSFTVYYFYTEISGFTPVLSIRIVLDSFYLFIFYSEKFSNWFWRFLFAVNVNLNLSVIIIIVVVVVLDGDTYYWVYLSWPTIYFKFITKCDKFITKYDEVLLSATIITNCDRTW